MSDPSKSIDRTSQILNNLTRSKYSTINGYFRKNRNKISKDSIQGSNICIPLDIVNVHFFLKSVSVNLMVVKNLYVSRPTPSIVRNIHHFNSGNWVVVCDLHTWNIDLKRGFTPGQAHLLSNSDVIITENNTQRTSSRKIEFDQ